MQKICMPQEIEVWYVLPKIRGELAKELKKQGLNQRQVAEKLGITPAAVSQYMHHKRGEEIVFTPEIMTAVQCAATRIFNGGQPIEQLHHILYLIRQTKLLCEIHRKQFGFEDEHCDVCLKY